MSETKTALKVLEVVQDIFSNEENFTTGTLVNQYAPLFAGVSPKPKPKYCLLGALAKGKGYEDKEIAAFETYSFALNTDGSGPILLYATQQLLAKKAVEALAIGDKNEAKKYVDVASRIFSPEQVFLINDRLGYFFVKEVVDRAVQIAEAIVTAEEEGIEVSEYLEGL